MGVALGGEVDTSSYGTQVTDVRPPYDVRATGACYGFTAYATLHDTYSAWCFCFALLVVVPIFSVRSSKASLPDCESTCVVPLRRNAMGSYSKLKPYRSGSGLGRVKIICMHERQASAVLLLLHLGAFLIHLRAFLTQLTIVWASMRLRPPQRLVPVRSIAACCAARAFVPRAAV